MHFERRIKSELLNDVLYHVKHQRIYAVSGQQIVYFDDQDHKIEYPPFSWGKKLLDTGHFLLSFRYGDLTTYDLQKEVDTHSSSREQYYEMAFNDKNNYAYVSSDDEVKSLKIDQTTGRISHTAAPYYKTGWYHIIKVSPDGLSLILDNGDILDANTLAFKGTLQYTFDFAIWSENNEFITVKKNNNSNAK